jgi:hypothetical protein
VRPRRCENEGSRTDNGGPFKERGSAGMRNQRHGPHLLVVVVALRSPER